MALKDDTDLDIRNKLLNAENDAGLISVIGSINLRDKPHRKSLNTSLVELHNSSQLDIVATYAQLKKPPSNGGDFFLLRHTFEEIIADLNGNASEMMQCVMHLTKEAGNDLASGTLLPHLVNWLDADNGRLDEAFKLLVNDSKNFESLMPQIIEAGSRTDPDKYIAYCINLMQGDDIELRRKAIFSIGRVSFTETPDFAKPCASAIAVSAQKNDDRLRATALKSLFHICRSDISIFPDTLAVIQFLLETPEEYTLHAAAELFAWELKEIPESLLVTLLEKLQKTPILNAGTWEFIDQGIRKLVKTEQQEKAITFLEELAIDVPDLDIFKTFKSTYHSLLEDRKLVSKVVTRWLLRGGASLKNFAAKMIHQASSVSPIGADVDEFDPDSPIHVVFLARKAIGYFFLNEGNSATNFILSLMNSTSSKDALKTLSQLLEDPLLLNYPEDVRSLLETPEIEVTSNTKKYIEKALSSSEQYYSALRKVGELPELQIPQSEQDGHMKNMASKARQAMKEEEGKSALLSMVSKSVILHGNRAAYTIVDLNGQQHRSEIAMQSHGHSVTVPRMSILTPYDFDLMLRIFRAERIKE